VKRDQWPVVSDVEEVESGLLFIASIYVKGVLGENGTSCFGGFGVGFCTLWVGVEGESGW